MSRKRNPAKRGKRKKRGGIFAATPQ